MPVRPAVALAVLSAALTAVLFLLVLLLVTGWSLSPLAAAATMSLLPLAAVAGARLPGRPAIRAPIGAALVLDARMPPLDKLDVVGALVADLDAVDPRGELAGGFNAAPIPDDPAHRAARTTRGEIDETIVIAVREAFAPVFLACGALALAACAVLLPRRGRGRARGLLAAAAAPATVALAAAARDALAPEPVRIADPCKVRRLPAVGGISGLTQDLALRALDGAPCEPGSSREEFALALVDRDAARRYEKQYGIDPSSLLHVVPRVIDGREDVRDDILSLLDPSGRGL